jgi:hypothetical protein
MASQDLTSIPYFFAADSRKSNTSLFETMDRLRSLSAPSKAAHHRSSVSTHTRSKDEVKMLTLDQVITMNRGRDGSLLHPAGHELKERHLSTSILHSNPLNDSNFQKRR